MNTSRRTRGFTLIDVIIFLVIGGILAVMVTPYFRSGVTSENVPIDRLQVSSCLNSAMEAVVRDYGISSMDTKALGNIADNLNNKYAANYGSYCKEATGKAETVTVGSLDNALLVMITSNSGEKLYHVFTIQK